MDIFCVFCVVTDISSGLLMYRPDPVKPVNEYIGKILVPVGAYKLQVSSGGDPENEQLAQIEIPANLAYPGASVSGPSLGN